MMKYLSMPLCSKNRHGVKAITYFLILGDSYSRSALPRVGNQTYLSEATGALSRKEENMISYNPLYVSCRYSKYIVRLASCLAL